MLAESVIKRPKVLTEKATALQEANGVFVFEVDKRATKGDIKAAVETLYNVRVQQVRTLIMRGKQRRLGRRYVSRPNWKKAFVQLHDGQMLDVFAE